MLDLSFQVEDAEPVSFAASPLLAFKLRITADTPEPDGAEVSIQTVALRAQIRIEPARRSYARAEQDGLLDLFGETHRWGQTQKSMLWTHTSLIVPPFMGATLVDLHVTCTYDFNLAATKYFHSLESGEIPLFFLFSGTIFYADPDGALQVAQIPWEKEASYRLPLATWRSMMDLYYPNTSWLCLRKDVFDRLYQFKTQSGLPTWELALERLLPPAHQGGPS
jgi:Family of unknown function (DUF6084)